MEWLYQNARNAIRSDSWNFSTLKDRSYSGFFCSQPSFMCFVFDRPHSIRFFRNEIQDKAYAYVQMALTPDFFSSIYTNGNWQWCKREVGLFRHVASCAKLNDRNDWSSARIGDTWKVWPPCVCDNAGSVRRILRNAIHIPPRNICTAFLLKQRNNVIVRLFITDVNIWKYGWKKYQQLVFFKTSPWSAMKFFKINWKTFGFRDKIYELRSCLSYREQQVETNDLQEEH